MSLLKGGSYTCLFCQNFIYLKEKYTYIYKINTFTKRVKTVVTSKGIQVRIDCK